VAQRNKIINFSSALAEFHFKTTLALSLSLAGLILFERMLANKRALYIFRKTSVEPMIMSTLYIHKWGIYIKYVAVCCRQNAQDSSICAVQPGKIS